ncbi:uncharacterized protein LOC105428722 [Pogonomyrmex barbatus]|uniref:Uncharacterized protein LOC105428722 n=1 Tax=Pogonomyrmex barbatus TaxID=144034 RepID=A0A6I9WET8_9HYME|nr:uncharacterized protein LOC105428722 [Pogonomyrmex barbatus]
MPSHIFDRWIVKADRNCTFIFKTSSGEGIFAVIQKMFFRRNGDQCLDYVRFKRSDGHHTAKFCGEIDRSWIMSLPISKDDLDADSFNYAEYDSVKKWKPWSIGDIAMIETEIFISKERVPSGQTLDLLIVYTPYKGCSHADPKQYRDVGFNNCIRKEYVCDEIYNCPFGVCSDEADCPVRQTERYSKNNTSTKITVAAVTTMVLCFILFIICLWVCKKSQKLCWSSDCAGPNVRSRPVSFPNTDGGPESNRTVSTAPMLEVAVSSPVADKDLPPSYDSLFPEQSNSARS